MVTRYVWMLLLTNGGVNNTKSVSKSPVKRVMYTGDLCHFYMCVELKKLRGCYLYETELAPYDLTNENRCAYPLTRGAHNEELCRKSSRERTQLITFFVRIIQNEVDCYFGHTIWQNELRARETTKTCTMLCPAVQL